MTSGPPQPCNDRPSLVAIDELLALDVLTLRAHTERAGVPLTRWPMRRHWELVAHHQIAVLRSPVYKTNLASQAFDPQEPEPTLSAS